MTLPRKSPPAAVGDVLADYLRTSGLAARVEQAAVIPEWPRLVGPQIAAVTEPLLITADGTLFVAVASSAWMTELSLMERQLLATVNAVPGRPPVVRIRWRMRG
jgi:predicted nucleic acid-binding Zn ribbon protein